MGLGKREPQAKQAARLTGPERRRVPGIETPFADLVDPSAPVFDQPDPKEGVGDPRILRQHSSGGGHIPIDRKPIAA